MFKPKGIVPPVVTPFTEDGQFNEKVYRALVSHLIDEGVHGIFPMGTTGEFYAISEAEYEKIIEVTVDEVNSRADIYVGASHISTREVIKLIKIAEKYPIQAISVLTPMFVSQTQGELYDFYQTIANNTSLPIIMYNNRPKTNVHIAPETAAKLGQIDNIIGIKDSTGDMTNAEEYIRLTKDLTNFSVLMGRDTLVYAGLCYGAVGAIASCANIAPKIAVRIYENFMRGEHEQALAAQFEFAPLRIAAGMGTFPEVIKEGLELQGFPVGKCLEPIARLEAHEAAKLKEVMTELNLI